MVKTHIKWSNSNKCATPVIIRRDSPSLRLLKIWADFVRRLTSVMLGCAAIWPPFLSFRLNEAKPVLVSGSGIPSNLKEN